jgi:carboxynorspermidine decarboxylase
METRAGDPGAFAHFDLSRVDSPAFVVDARGCARNLAHPRRCARPAGIKVLSALKAFSMWKVAPIIGEYLDGVCSSGLWEARLAASIYERRDRDLLRGLQARGPARDPAACPIT